MTRLQKLCVCIFVSNVRPCSVHSHWIDPYQSLKCKTLFDLSLPAGRCARLVGWSGPAFGECCPPSHVGEADDHWLRSSGGAAWLFAAGHDARAPWSSSEAVLALKTKNKSHRKEGTTITHSHVLRNCSGCFVRNTRLNPDPKIQAALKKNLLCGSISHLIYKNYRTNLLKFHRGLYVDVTDVMADKNTYNSTYNICDLFQDQSRSNSNFSRDSLSPPASALFCPPLKFDNSKQK